MLRRRKREVAPELPPRTDVVLHCVLSDSERVVYDTVRAATLANVVALLEAGGSVLAALEALLRLRQACCHRAKGDQFLALVRIPLEIPQAVRRRSEQFTGYPVACTEHQPEILLVQPK